MKQASLALVLILGLVSVSCASVGAGTASGNYQDMITKAEQAYKSVDEQGGAWRDTGEMIADAKKAAEAGDFSQAFALASEAYDQSMMAMKQKEAEAKAGPWLF